MCSLSASPEPRPSQKRPGYIALIVAAAWAMIAGGRRHERPHERRIPLLRRPRLDMVCGHHTREASGFRLLAETAQLARMELLEHCSIADLGHALNLRALLGDRRSARPGEGGDHDTGDRD